MIKTTKELTRLRKLLEKLYEQLAEDDKPYWQFDEVAAVEVILEALNGNFKSLEQIVERKEDAE